MKVATRYQATGWLATCRNGHSSRYY